MLFVFTGCDISDPGTPIANLPPDTRLTSAPPEGTVTTSSGDKLNFSIHMFWTGSDIDGEVVAYDIAINDTSTWLRTVITDSVLFFSAPSGEAGDLNTFYVRAIDDAGAADPTPSIRSFTAHTLVPNTKINGDPSRDDTTGRGVRFHIVGKDEDGAEFNYSFSLDSRNDWSDWQEDSIIVFGTDDVPGSHGLLDPGSHILYARVRDMASAVDASPDSISFIVVEGFKPDLEITKSDYDGLPIYWDGSVFSSQDNVESDLTLKWNLDTESYFGTYFLSRFSMDGGAFSEWDDTVSVVWEDIQPGEHTFMIEAKDIAGELDTLTLTINIVNPALDNGIALIDQNGGKLADDADVDLFYTNVITSAGRSVDLIWDVTEDNLEPTPAMFYDHSLVIWYGDENPISEFQSNTRLITDYLDRGGNLLFGGLQAVSALSSTSLPASFSESDLLYDYFKIEGANSFDDTDFSGGQGNTEFGYPSVNIDPAKIIIPSWEGNLLFMDIFTLRDDVSNAVEIMHFVSAGGDPQVDGAVCAVRYLGDDYSVILLGFALYYTVESEAVVLMDKMLTDLGE